LADVGRLGDQHSFDRHRPAGRLVGDHAGAEHRLGGFAHLVDGLDQLDAAGLAAAAGVDLRLDHPVVAADGLGGFGRLAGGTGDAPGRNGDAGLGEQLLGLVLVEIHGHLRKGRRGRRRSRAGCGREGAHCRRERPAKAKAHAVGWPGREPANPKQPMPSNPKDIASPQHRELYFFALFRVLESGILGIVAFTPLGLTMAEIRQPLLIKLADRHLISAPRCCCSG
jgi:hypothetical protein